MRYVAFLRAINVGGNNIVKMDHLRKLFEEAIRILLSNLSPGTEVCVQLATTEIIGRMVETTDHDIVLIASGQWSGQWFAIPTADVISIRRPLKKRVLLKGRAFVIGATAGAGLAVVTLIVATAASRR
jgi:hypothetical protein